MGVRVLFALDSFPNYSETFIRDQIANVIDNGVEIRILTYNGFVKKNVDALKGFEEYPFKDYCVSIDAFVKKTKWYRVLYVIRHCLMKVFNPKIRYLLKSLDRNKYGCISKNLTLFYLVNYILNNRINVIHAHYGPNGNKMALLKKLGLPVKLITTFHGYDIRLGFSEGKEYYNLLREYGDIYLSISDYNKSSLLQFGFDNRKIVELPNGVDIEFFKNDNLNNSAKTKEIRFLTVARLVPEKNIGIAIKAFSKIWNTYPKLNFSYFIVGDGIERDNLEKLVLDLDLEENVFFLGTKTRSQVRDILIISDVFILPSREEALPTVILEAKSCGLPILATDVGSVRKMIENCGVVVEPNSEESMVKGFEAILAKKEEWLRMGQNGRNEVKDKFDARKISNKLIEIYCE